jgi:hypothetical protein
MMPPVLVPTTRSKHDTTGRPRSRSRPASGALQVGEGLGNQEVATRLFFSHKTTEVHLRYTSATTTIARRSLRTSLAKLISSGIINQ